MIEAAISLTEITEMLIGICFRRGMSEFSPSDGQNEVLMVVGSLTYHCVVSQRRLNNEALPWWYVPERRTA